jgi:hypothetical protein
MDYSNRRYLVIPTSNVSQIDFSQVLETSAETLRISVDGLKTFVKYNLPNRPTVYSSQYPEYTHEQMLIILATSEWTSSQEI